MKRNFIFDLIHHAPPLLKKELVEQIGSENNQIYKYYSNCKEGYYSCNNLNYYEKKELDVLLETYRINAVNFTDSRASYQFYNLKDLYRQIEIANKLFFNKISDNPIEYNLKTIYDKVYNGDKGYIADKVTVLQDLKNI